MNPIDTTREVLLAHGLPAGLLPSNIQDVRLDEAVGDFEVRLTTAVDRTISEYAVHYKATISGRLRKGRVERLKGVQVKRGLWIPVGTIEADGDHLVFVVGPVRKRIPAAAFGAR